MVMEDRTNKTNGVSKKLWPLPIKIGCTNKVIRPILPFVNILFR